MDFITSVKGNNDMTQIARNIQLEQAGRAHSLTSRTCGGGGIKQLIGLILFAAIFMGATMSSLATFSITAVPSANPAGSSVCPGDQITVTIVEDCMDPDDEWYYAWLNPNNINDWTYTVNWETYTVTFVGHYTAQTGDAGNQLTWTYEDYCYGPSSTSPITVVGADSVTISPNYADNWVGNSITYTVVLKPSGATSPDTITWTGDVTSGSTGTSTSKSYTDTGSKTATAHVGTSTASGTVTIHQIISLCTAQVPTPPNRTTLGILEQTTLALDPSANAAWTPDANSIGHSSLTGNGAQSFFTAGKTDKENPKINCRLGDANGPQSTLTYSIVAPSGFSYVGVNPALCAPFDTMVLV
jgi:hypothetical protein